MKPELVQEFLDLASKYGAPFVIDATPEALTKANRGQLGRVRVLATIEAADPVTLSTIPARGRILVDIESGFFASWLLARAKMAGVWRPRVSKSGHKYLQPWGFRPRVLAAIRARVLDAKDESFPATMRTERP